MDYLSLDIKRVGEAGATAFQPRPSAADLVLVRHAEVADRFAGVCYGQSDVELGRAGERDSRRLAELLAALPVSRIVHSGLSRTRFLAEALGKAAAIEPECCPALRERHYGSWELRRWDDLHAEHGRQMLRMISEPASFRPGGGETTYAMRDRILRWFRSLRCGAGLTVAVTHGGPIAALLGSLRELPVAEWPKLIPPYSECLWISSE